MPVVTPTTTATHSRFVPMGPARTRIPRQLRPQQWLAILLPVQRRLCRLTVLAAMGSVA